MLIFNKKSIAAFLLLLLFTLATLVARANVGLPHMQQLEKISINGTEQWIYITGEKKDNPVLLVLHGGPGFAMLPLFHEKLPNLEHDFTVVNWDQRGAGKSYSNKISSQSMSLNQFVADAHEVTQILKKRFNTPKIYLLGHSSGTMVGVLLAKKYPEDYAAYIAVGQVVNFAENEIASYDFALKSAIKHKHLAAEKQLKAVGRPDKTGDYLNEDGYEVTSKWVEYFGGSLFRNTSLDSIYDLIFESDVYKKDQKKILKGYNFSQKLFDDNHMRTFNLLEEAPSLKIPVYILAGKHDFETPSVLMTKYFDNLKIPNKNIVEFSQSAHFPFYEEPEKFITVMRKIKSSTVS